VGGLGLGFGRFQPSGNEVQSGSLKAEDESGKAETDAKNLTIRRSSSSTLAIGVRGKTIDESRENKTERGKLDSEGQHSPHDSALGFGKVFIAGEEVQGEAQDERDETASEEEVDIRFPGAIVLVQSN